MDTQNQTRYSFPNHFERFKVTFARKMWRWYLIWGVPISFACGLWIGYNFRAEKLETINPIPAQKFAEIKAAPEIIPDGDIMEAKLPMNTFSSFVPVTKKDKVVVSFVKRFSDVAISEHQKYNIPASITLAQGGLESDWGRSKLAQKANNFFGVKCLKKRCRKGHCINFNSDHHKDFFRLYGSAWESFRDHSKLLNYKRYKPCHGKTINDFCHCLKSKGYATDKKYATKLIAIIKKYGLSEFDKN